MSLVKKHKLKIITLILYLITLIYNQDIFIKSIYTTGGYLKEMVQILPAVFIVSGLITVWVPKEIIIKNFGKDSGLKGKLISVFIGSISAGPIYAAFPVAFSLFNKGASISNIVIIISSWAVVKVPMMIVEAKFLGYSFMLARVILTIPAIMIIGYFTNKFVEKEDIKSKVNGNRYEKYILEIENILPKFNCGGCGYGNCNEYAKAIVMESESIDKCSVMEDKTKTKIKDIVCKVSEKK
ncbi:MAG: Fe-S cluster protein [Firmicutes bacterium]|nr:Fe-S cluster protein [Bacillota bacterium]